MANFIPSTTRGFSNKIRHRVVENRRNGLISCPAPTIKLILIIMGGSRAGSRAGWEPGREPGREPGMSYIHFEVTHILDTS